MFVDRANLKLKAGDGGNGAVSFRREARINMGGPNGGNGGRGGDVILQVEEGMGTLYDFRGKTIIRAQNGENGGGKQCTGSDASDEIIKVPPGTQVYDEVTGELIFDLGPRDRVIVCKGGRGGFGNEHFKTSINRAPHEAEPGHAGEERQVRLELKLIADVGLVGKPNAGKSTLLAAMTRATPKIGNYPFTTLTPQLGIAAIDPSRRFVIADIPGLIEGASDGAGLGHEFLRHIERTRVIVHLLDVAPPDGSDPAKSYRVIREELEAYSKELAAKPELVVFNKLDQIPDEKERKKIVKKLCDKLELDVRKDVLLISGATREGLEELKVKVWQLLNPKGEHIEGWKPAPVEE